MTPWTVARQAPLSMGILQARITGVDFHALSMTQGLNFGLLHWQVDSLPLSQQGSPGNLGMFGQMWCNSKFIIQVVFYMNANFLSSYCESESRSVVSDSLRLHGLQPTRLLCPWGFSRQEYWCELPCPSPGNLPNAGIKPRSPALQADSLPAELPGKPISIITMQRI